MKSLGIMKFLKGKRGEDECEQAPTKTSSQKSDFSTSGKEQTSANVQEQKSGGAAIFHQPTESVTILPLSYDQYLVFLLQNSQLVQQVLTSGTCIEERLNVRSRCQLSNEEIFRSVANELNSYRGMAPQLRASFKTLFSADSELDTALKSFASAVARERSQTEKTESFTIVYDTVDCRLKLSSTQSISGSITFSLVITATVETVVIDLTGSFPSYSFDGTLKPLLQKQFDEAFREIAALDSVAPKKNVREAGIKRAAVYNAVQVDDIRSTSQPKTEETLAVLLQAIETSVLFSSFSSGEKSKIVEVFESIEVAEGTAIITQGDAGDDFYIIETGKVEVHLDQPNGGRIRVGQPMGPGASFGEVALLYDVPRTATVICVQSGILWRVNRQTFRFVVSQANQQSLAEDTDFVRNVEVLGRRLGDVLNEKDLSHLVTALEVETFRAGDCIIRQGQAGDSFFIIKEGEVAVHKLPTGSSSSTELGLGPVVATLGPGRYFGEKAILQEDVRQASCIAVGSVTCLSMSREMFIRLVGSWRDLAEGGQAQAAAASSQDESAAQANGDGAASSDGPAGASTSFSVASLADVEVMATLGQGAFGRVRLAKDKMSDKVFVLKIQNKAMIVGMGMEAVVTTEIKLMREVNHPFVVSLYNAFQDNKALYIALELLQGGDFFSVLKKCGKLTEDKARFYSSIVVTGLEAMHAASIAYRDLKPENMVMDHRGYIKLVDLGLAKKVVSGKTWTLCGTPDYIAPEIVLNKGHDQAVDYWALGVLMFEMIDGWPPFYDDNPMKVYSNVVAGKVDYPKTFSENFVNLLQGLLQKSPAKRLGNARGGVSEIKKHKWFGSFDWLGLLKGTIVPPYVPEIKNPLDISNFDRYDEDEGPDAQKPSTWVAELD